MRDPRARQLYKISGLCLDQGQKTCAERRDWEIPRAWKIRKNLHADGCNRSNAVSSICMDDEYDKNDINVALAGPRRRISQRSQNLDSRAGGAPINFSSSNLPPYLSSQIPPPPVFFFFVRHSLDLAPISLSLEKRQTRPEHVVAPPPPREQEKADNNTKAD